MSKTKSSLDGQSRGYKIFVVIVLALLAVFFIFPLYWILTGSLKDAITINARTPQWFPLEPTLDNYVRLFKQPAIQWLLNTIIIAVAAMALTCITAALAGYALAKKRFWGQTALFSLLVFTLLAAVSRLLDRPWPQAVCAYLAKISYAVFLVHHVLIQRMVERFDLAALGRRDTLFLFLIYLGGTWAAAVGLLWLHRRIQKGIAALRPQ